MARFRGGNLRPINRIKHVVDSQFATAIATIFDVSLISTVDAPVLANSDECETGSRVNGIYLDIEVISTSVTGVLGNAYIMVFKNPGNNLAMPNPNGVGIVDNKKWIIHQEMVMLDSTAGSTAHIPRTIFKGVIGIPKLYRRNGPDDQLSVRMFTPGITANWCLQCHYKEYR